MVINQDLVRHILEAGGHAVDIVCNGAEAIMAVQDTAFDVVLMDVQMPYFDGLAATRAIRSLTHPCRNVPIVAMTANVLPEQTKRALEVGMDAVIHKPFSAAQIFDTLERFGGVKSIPPSYEDAPDTLERLAALIGETKVRALLDKLAVSLVERFDGDGATAEARLLLRQEAHASVAGSGMLGFEAFATRCRAFEHSKDDTSFGSKLAALKQEAAQVAKLAASIAAGDVPIVAVSDNTGSASIAG